MNKWGITGTNGKTTTAWVLAEFIAADARRKCGFVTTVEVFNGVDRFSTGYTTPPLSQLAEIYAQMESNGCTDCVMEVSSHAIHQNRVGFGNESVFAGGAFTNLSEDHLDYHKSMDEYFRVKLSFAERIAAATPNAPYAVCLDGENGERMFSEAKKLDLRVIPVTVKEPSYDLSRLPLVGDYNKSNVLLAASLAEAAGIGKETIQSTIPKLAPRWGRLERVDTEATDADVYVDFAHTPDGLEKVLKAARGFTKKELWVVFGAGGDRDPIKRPLMGLAAAQLADKIVITSDNPRSEEPSAIIAQVLEGAKGVCRDTQVHVEPDRRAAIEYALGNSSTGDVVIIAGKGHETTQEIRGVKHPFDDRQVVSSAKRFLV